MAPVSLTPPLPETDTPPPLPTRPPRPRPAWLQPTPQNILIAAFGAVAVIAVLVVAVVVGSPAPPKQSVAATATTLSDLAAENAAVQPVVDQLSTYVEQARGLKFVHPVKATVLSSGQFDARLVQMGATRLDASALGDIATRKALGLLPADYDPAKQPADTSAILGIYDPQTKTILVRGADISVFTRQTLVHELTHALQDQHFDLSRFLAGGDNDAALAARALIEGDARRVETNWVSTLGIDEQNALERQARASGDEEFPPGYLLSIESFPYVVGSQFANDLLSIGGQAELDKAFTRPPTSTKQVIDASVYASGQDPVTVHPPAAGGPVISSGTLGEFELIYVLAQVMPLQDAAPLAGDWSGGSYVTWQSPAGPCTRANLVTTTREGSLAMAAALQAWASAVPGRSVSAGPVLTLTSCA